MTVQSADSAFAGLRASADSIAGRVTGKVQDQPRTSSFLYQGATILAILLFLISFWSC